MLLGDCVQSGAVPTAEQRGLSDPDLLSLLSLTVLDCLPLTDGHCSFQTQCFSSSQPLRETENLTSHPVWCASTHSSHVHAKAHTYFNPSPAHTSCTSAPSQSAHIDVHTESAACDRLPSSAPPPKVTSSKSSLASLEG